MAVPDGDDVLVVRAGIPKDVRLNGIDCPEKGQAHGRRATQFTSDHTLGKDITLRTHGLDKYGRMIGDVILQDGSILNRELVQAGLCWWYREYSNDQTLGDLEAEAREAKRGLWQDSFPVPPWDYRRLHRARSSEQAELGLPGIDRQGTSGTDQGTKSVAQFPIIGNTKSGIYHFPDCPNYSQVSARYRVRFASIQDAEAAGYRRARNCP